MTDGRKSNVIQHNGIFLSIIIIVFNMTTEFLQRIGILGAMLTVTEIQYYGVFSIMLAINNFLSQKFFGVDLFR